LSETAVSLAIRAGARARARIGDAVAHASRYQRFLLLSPVAVFILGFFLFPFISLFRVSLARNPGGTGYGEGTRFYIPGSWTLDNYVRFFADPYFVQMAVFTIELGIIVAVVTTVVSYALGYQIYRAAPLLKSVLLLVVILPKFTNVLVLMYGLLVVFGSSGLVNKLLQAIRVVDEPIPMLFNLFSVVLGQAILVLPYCVLVIAAVLHAIDASLLEAAQGLGASRARAFWEVTLPLSLPAVWVSLLLSFMWGMGAFAAPYLLGNPDLYTLAVEVDRQTNWRLNWAMGATVAFVLMGIITVLMFAYSRMQREGARA